MARVTTETVLRYAQKMQARSFATLTAGRPFRVSANGGEIVFYPASGRPFRPELERYVSAFNRRPSFRPTDYPKDLWSRSYFVALIAAMLSGKLPTALAKRPSHAKSEPPSPAFEVRVRQLRRSGARAAPLGEAFPKRTKVSIEQIERDPAVKAWVLEHAGGVCELCHQAAPFEDDAGDPFLELHHVHHLADGGADTISNAVAICPNCHRACHHSRRRHRLAARLYRQCRRLIKPSLAGKLRRAGAIPHA